MADMFDIARWNIYPDDGPGVHESREHDGKYVLYTDAVRELSKREAALIAIAVSSAKDGLYPNKAIHQVAIEGLGRVPAILKPVEQAPAREQSI